MDDLSRKKYRENLWVKKFQKIFVSSFCREFNMPSGFHHLTAVDICQPTLQLKLQIEAEKVLSSSDDEFFHKNKSMKKKILHKTGQVIYLEDFAWSWYLNQTCNLQAEIVCLDWADKM